jgi:hypothetical protein
MFSEIRRLERKPVRSGSTRAWIEDWSLEVSTSVISPQKSQPWEKGDDKESVIWVECWFVSYKFQIHKKNIAKTVAENNRSNWTSEISCLTSRYFTRASQRNSRRSPATRPHEKTKKEQLLGSKTAWVLSRIELIVQLLSNWLMAIRYVGWLYVFRKVDPDKPSG